jgi:uncharacterized protein YcnI
MHIASSRRTMRTPNVAPTGSLTLPGTLVPALLLALLLASPALAHPVVAGGARVPVQSLATITLDLAHGCGVEGAGSGPDTDRVALEVPEWLRIVEVPTPDGWTVSLEAAGQDQQDQVVVWSAAGAREPAPRFALDVVVDGEAGETRYLRVSQRCGDLVERWVGTPDEPADQPAVRLLLEPADPSSPAPPVPAAPEAQEPPGSEPGSEPAPGSVDASSELEAVSEDDAVAVRTAGLRAGLAAVIATVIAAVIAALAVAVARRANRTRASG